ncbi:MFS transporter [Cupriavidus sp. RAF12]|uniref:MFS transporter n=1 Tax=Cupriavidus sp. RAF12 TaxID=3233050 RepID=UPI003F8D9ECD
MAMRPLIFCAVQCLLAVTWTIYTAFLPQLAAQAGIPRPHVAWILLMDQAVFVVMDCAMGMAADRMASAMQRLGTWILAIAVLSGAAFVLLPQSTSPALLLGLTALWAATSSALRAPPMVIIARGMQRSAPMLVSWSVLGIGIAGALGPLLTAGLRNVSPALPFALASAGLIVAVAALRWVDKAPHVEARAGAGPDRARIRMLWLFFAAALTLAFGFQVHTTINSAPAYLKFVSSADLVRYMPAFWLGFVACVLLPDTAMFRRAPAHGLLLVAVVLGVIAFAGFAMSATMAGVLVAQCAAGGVWGVVFGAVTHAALRAGHVGREGLLTGMVFAVSALAAFARIAIMLSGIHQRADMADLLRWLPVASWAVAAVLLAAFIARNAAYLREGMLASGPTALPGG